MLESEIVAAGSVNGVLSGKHYNRCMRAHKLIFEAMQRMRFEAFRKSLPETKADDLKRLGTDLLLQCSDRQMFTDVCDSNEFDAVRVAYDSFVEKKSKENPTFAFWSTYIAMVQLLLLYIRATRTSDWELHLSALRSMIPWFFATDRVNYSRYAPLYWLEMSFLKSTHPCKLFSYLSLDLIPRGQGVVLPIMDYIGMLHSTGEPFSGHRYKRRVPFQATGIRKGYLFQAACIRKRWGSEKGI